MCVPRSSKSEHGEHLLQAEKLPESHQVLPHGSGSGSQHSQGNEVSSSMFPLQANHSRSCVCWTHVQCFLYKPINLGLVFVGHVQCFLYKPTIPGLVFLVHMFNVLSTSQSFQVLCFLYTSSMFPLQANHSRSSVVLDYCSRLLTPCFTQ